ncbi:MAG: filamentous hemagglutinin N-terminal domain-containing protein [Candidatus Accumulibacter cognatus]|uniref:Filamentous hemagglutinin N-terminal domain-containing protein n=2 Tax=Candidatus Accumulibacter TaxID=327159 RepID=A0A7D5NDX5_9PROT|nr:MAG: filamentous hemagglutinin N-terminal domain-containing protein [Candidatus Accumulibacter cognatus]
MAQSRLCEFPISSPAPFFTSSEGRAAKWQGSKVSAQHFRSHPTAAALLAATFCALPALAVSDIVRDGSIGAGPTLALTPSGTVTRGAVTYQKITIPENYGQRAGSNVFHSFAKFSVGNGDGAVFTIDTAARNVFARVTGGQLSAINGLLKLDPGSTGSAPNFFFINPAGVSFGAGAVVDVPAALHVSTANYLKFPDGHFHADTTSASTFSSASPEDFGFLGTTRATVTVNGGTLLRPSSPASVSVVGGDIVIDHGHLVTIGGGDLRVVAVGQHAQEVPFSGKLRAAYGNIDIMNGGTLQTAATGATEGGQIAVSAGNIRVDSGSGGLTGIRSRAENGTGKGGDLDIAAANNMLLTNDGVIASDTVTSGKAGSVEVTVAGTLAVHNGAYIDSSTYSSSDAGSVKVSASSLTLERAAISSGTYDQGSGNAGYVDVAASNSLTLLNGGLIESSTWSSGNAGVVGVRAGSLTIDGRGGGSTGIFSVARDGSTGQAGRVEVAASGNIEILNQGLITSSTASSGDAGSVKVSTGSLTIEEAGIASGAFGTTGMAGSVEVLARDHIAIRSGGIITSSTTSSGDAGSVKVSSGSLSIDGQGANISSAAFGTTGKAGRVEVVASKDIGIRNGGYITSSTSSTGMAGSVEVDAAGKIEILNGGYVYSSTFASGHAGSVQVSAGEITIDGQGSVNSTGISSGASSGSTGNGGSVYVLATGKLELLNAGRIDSSTLSSGDAGLVRISAGSLTIDGQGSAETGISSGAYGTTGKGGSVEVAATRNISLLNAGKIDSSTLSSGDAGSVRVSTGSLTLAGEGTRISSGAYGTTGKGGSVEVTATENISLLDAGRIDSSTLSSGDAGSVRISTGSLTLAGQRTRISSGAYGTAGNGGSVEVVATEQVSLFGAGRIDSSTSSSGDAGSVKVNAGSLIIDGQGSTAGIGSAAFGSTGKGGRVDVAVSGNISIFNGGYINTSTFSSGDAGSVRVSAGSLNIDGQGAGAGIGSDPFGASGNTGNAGSIDVAVLGHFHMLRGGYIDASTFSAGDAGSVKVRAGSLSIDGQGLGAGITSGAYNGSTGRTGNVEVLATGNMVILDGGYIDSSTTSSSDAGAVKVFAHHLTIDGHGYKTGISSDAAFGSTGKAGSVDVQATGGIAILGGGRIDTSTHSSGQAGSVKVSTAGLSVDGQGFTLSGTGVFSNAEALSAGQTGSVLVSASDRITLANGGGLSVQNFATVANPGALIPTTLAVSAPTILLKDTEITAASTGNVAASQVQVDFSQRLALDNSGITTSANQGNGGSIDITGGQGTILLDNAQISTSVKGVAGNGGDIHVQAHTLIMNTGFIQANTAARNAAGGHVQIDVQALVPSGDTLFIGGQTPYIFQPGVFSFNVIQAAAPTGVSGVVQISTPLLDISGALTGFNVQLLDSGGLGHHPCRITGGSSLVQTGRGGFAPSARDLLGPAPGIHDGRRWPAASLPGDPSYFSASWKCANDAQTMRS